MAQNEGLVFPIKNEDDGSFEFKTSQTHNILKSEPNHNTGSLAKNIAHGPIVENLMDQSARTKADISNLATTRTSSTSTTATGQPLTQYHSFFHSLFSWEHPRASGIAYIVSVLCIFAARYLNIVRYGLKVTYVILGITVLAEVAGKIILAHGFTSQIRPKKYYTVSRETLNLLTGDFHELINFFVIQAQQIIFAENLAVSIAAFISAFISYFLVKFVPLWGLSLLGTSTLFMGTLVYKTNQELIDHNVKRTIQIINQQTEQVKAIASEQAARATKQTKALVGDYSVKAQEMINSSLSPLASPTSTKTKQSDKIVKEKVVKAEDFPKAPIEELKPVKEFEVKTMPLVEDQILIST
ncbi:putative cell lysis protein [Golovinomyces cichoracearum]|uniref:Reticulon-like protein n=1 Tax=Golovinomyces cichoracearum TaxID=62708 RepID=A0A420INU5_9PEZI|nr:putative cell lysis protein [Golovinomyces cichoracearum]